MVVYSFISYSDFICEITVHAADSSEKSKAVRLGLSLYTYLIMQSCFT